MEPPHKKYRDANALDGSSTHVAKFSNKDGEHVPRRLGDFEPSILLSGSLGSLTVTVRRSALAVCVSVCVLCVSVCVCVCGTLFLWALFYFWGFMGESASTVVLTLHSVSLSLRQARRLKVILRCGIGSLCGCCPSVVCSPQRLSVFGLCSSELSRTLFGTCTGASV